MVGAIGIAFILIAIIILGVSTMSTTAVAGTPLITVTNPTNASYIGQSTFVINLTTSEACISVTATVNDGTNSTSFAPLTSANLTWGAVLPQGAVSNTTGAWVSWNFTAVDTATETAYVDPQGFAIMNDLTSPTLGNYTSEQQTDGTLDIGFDVYDAYLPQGCYVIVDHISQSSAADVTYTGTLANRTTTTGEYTCTVPVTGIGMSEGFFNATPYAYDYAYTDASTGAYSTYNTTTGTRYTNMTYNYLKQGWNLLSMTSSKYTLYNLTSQLSTITYASWYNNSGISDASGTAKTWYTYTASAGSQSTNNETVLTHLDGVYVAVNANTRWVRNISADLSTRNITIGVPGWNLIGFSNTSLNMSDATTMGQTLYNWTGSDGAVANVSIRYMSLFKPWETVQYRTYRYGFSDTPWTGIQAENLYTGFAAWVSPNVTVSAGDSTLYVNNTNWMVV